MIKSPQALLVVDLRELALIYEMSQEVAQNPQRHSSDRRTAAELHEDCARLLGRDETPK